VETDIGMECEGRISSATRNTVKIDAHVMYLCLGTGSRDTQWSE